MHSDMQKQKFMHACIVAEEEKGEKATIITDSTIKENFCQLPFSSIMILVLPFGAGGWVVHKTKSS